MPIEIESRPVVFDYKDIGGYVKDMINWLRASRKHYSLRAATRHVSDLSPSLITRIMKGERSLTRDRVLSLASVLELTEREITYLDSWVAHSRRPQSVQEPIKVKPSTTKLGQDGQNHLLENWLHVYVKDAARLRGFKPVAKVIMGLIGGIASEKKIERSLKFLLHHGFLRQTQEGRIVEDHVLSTTSDNIPSAKIRAFHKRALEIARQGIDFFPFEKRFSSTLTLPVNDESLAELQGILRNTYNQLLEFAEKHADDDQQLYQVLLNLTPVGGRREETVSELDKS